MQDPSLVLSTSVPYDSLPLSTMTIGSLWDDKEYKDDIRPVKFEMEKYQNPRVFRVIALYLSNLERESKKIFPYSLFLICCEYYVPEEFDENKLGRDLQLNPERRICTKTRDFGSNSGFGARSVYGSEWIGGLLCESVTLYKWTFYIGMVTDNMVIGIDSNPQYMRCDFSNYFRSHGGKKTEFCGYASDGCTYSWSCRDSEEYGVEWECGDTIEMSVHVDTNQLHFAVNGESQGVAMTNLRLNEQLYLMAVSLFYADDCIELVNFAVS